LNIEGANKDGGTAKYSFDGAPIPKDTMAKNVLEDMKVPQGKVDYVFEIIKRGQNKTRCSSPCLRL
jgi:hypothetical protein